MLNSDGRAIRLDATGDVFGGPARLVYINYLASATAGFIDVRDGGATGDLLLSIATPDSETVESVSLLVPLRFKAKPHATLTNVTSATFVYV
jgi:hypothetical protein